uniref:LIM zinc-binding domain-containing protein n=1 Tax=Periophthalmus magnuspinnatus TaxID=409849 RepID=A0A3B4B893_9GOBI
MWTRSFAVNFLAHLCLLLAEIGSDELTLRHEARLISVVARLWLFFHDKSAVIVPTMPPWSLMIFPEPPTQSPDVTQSDVYKMLQDYEEPVSEPKQSGSFKYLQGILENLKSPIRSPVPKMGNPISSPAPGLQSLPQCTRCCSGIVGTIVKARDKLYHPDCFMCDDCNINLKKRGYFFIEESLYCEACAMARVQPPEGYDVVAVYPNSKVQIV